jgi:CspA family cold shock protein
LDAIACGKIPELPGPVVIGLDVSGSMQSPVTGNPRPGVTEQPPAFSRGPSWGCCRRQGAPVHFVNLVASGDLLCYAGDISTRGPVTNGQVMPEGTIKKLTDKGFGFIALPGGKDIFFHSSNLEGVQYEDLHEGQKVSFVEGRGPKGPRAEQVKPA